MIFRTLTNTELARWVRCSPRDHVAKAEMLRRNVNAEQVQALMDEVDVLTDQVTELERQIHQYEKI